MLKSINFPRFQDGYVIYIYIYVDLSTLGKNPIVILRGQLALMFEEGGPLTFYPKKEKM